MLKRFSTLGILLIFLIGYLCAQRTAHAEDTQRVSVIAKRFAFEPAEITLKKGQPVDLVLTSTDVSHGLRFRELGVDVRVGKGGKSTVHFTPSKTGTFAGHCSVFCGGGHGTMTLTLHVVD